MKTVFTFICSLLLVIVSWGNEDAKKVSAQHVRSIVSGELQAMKDSYGKDVALMPGHEFLKEKYGLANDRKQKVVVKRDQLVAAILKAKGNHPKRAQERIDEKLKGLKYEVMETKVGDFATEASDPVGTPDGKLHFDIKEGDVLIKVSPPRGDFLLLLMRMEEGKWVVCAEYVD